MSVPLTDADDDHVPLLADLAAFRRPRLRPEVPLMWRTATSIQIGDDVIVDRVDRSLVAWTTSLDGSRTPQEIGDALTISAHDARRLVRALLAAGALEDLGRIPASLRWVAADVRDEARARLSAVMCTYRDPSLSHAIVDRRGAARLAVVGDGLLADSIGDSLRAAGLAVDGAGTTLTVLANALHPDVPAHFDNPAQDRPHLHVGVFGARAVVGPLVVPGRTGCLRCAHLHRRDADPAWPLVAVQWSQCVRALMPAPADPLLIRIAASSAALLARLMIDHPEDPGCWSGYAIEHTLPLADPVRVGRPPHPLCGCGWAQA